MPQQTWLITDCSSEFGEKFISILAASGDKTVATARTIESIQHLTGPNIALLSLDITAPQEELDLKIKEALSFFGGIGVLVNNAGYLRGGMLEEVKWDYIGFVCYYMLYDI